MAGADKVKYSFSIGEPSRVYQKDPNSPFKPLLSTQILENILNSLRTDIQFNQDMVLVYSPFAGRFDREICVTPLSVIQELKEPRFIESFKIKSNEGINVFVTELNTDYCPSEYLPESALGPNAIPTKIIVGAKVTLEYIGSHPHNQMKNEKISNITNKFQQIQDSLEEKLLNPKYSIKNEPISQPVKQ